MTKNSWKTFIPIHKIGNNKGQIRIICSLIILFGYFLFFHRILKIIFYLMVNLLGDSPNNYQIFSKLQSWQMFLTIGRFARDLHIQNCIGNEERSIERHLIHICSAHIWRLWILNALLTKCLSISKPAKCFASIYCDYPNASEQELSIYSNIWHEFVLT